MSDMTIDEAKELLDIKDGDDIAAVKKAVKRMSQRYHPDKEGGDAVKFDQVRVAGDVLLELLESYETIPTTEDLESVSYIASHLVQLYVHAEMSGENEKRRVHNKEVERQWSLGQLFFGEKRATPEAWALNRLEERLLKEKKDMRETVDNLLLQGRALKTMLKNYRAPSLARKAWQDVRDKLAKTIWESRVDFRTLDRRIQALVDFEEIIIETFKPKKTFSLPSRTPHVRYR